LIALAGFALSALVASGLTAGFVRWVPRIGLVDLPGARKVHVRPIPRGGGLAIYTACALSQLVPAFRWPQAGVILGTGSAIVFLGLLDDCRPLPWQFRLAFQFGAAAVAAWWLGGNPAGQTWLPFPVAVICIVALINAFNMLDNMDALSAGVALIVAAGGSAASAFNGTANDGWLIANVVFMGALAGFLWFNRPPARIFMGDAGSMFLGFFLGTQAIDRPIGSGGMVESAGVWLCLLAIPFYDMSSVISIRLIQGRSPFEGDKQHLSHRLVKLGLSQPRAVGLIHVIAFGFGTIGLLAHSWPTAPLVIVCGVWLALCLTELALHRGRLSSSSPGGTETSASVAEHG
jgi:UDP-GlcNAc:undecaprenyl-phosphate GlcNAc-1-phosphate transferase